MFRLYTALIWKMSRLLSLILWKEWGPFSSPLSETFIQFSEMSCLSTTDCKSCLWPYIRSSEISPTRLQTCQDPASHQLPSLQVASLHPQRSIKDPLQAYPFLVKAVRVLSRMISVWISEGLHCPTSRNPICTWTCSCATQNITWNPELPRPCFSKFIILTFSHWLCIQVVYP